MKTRIARHRMVDRLDEVIKLLNVNPNSLPDWARADYRMVVTAVKRLRRNTITKGEGWRD